ncbi:MAG: alpha/beta fold hydrolase [Alphaproteobacteria bacterium]|nr:alpha/beta fold hydrolase [Alphaproteobacteria bacterium]
MMTPVEKIDPALELVDALYAFAERPEGWLSALEAIERLPPPSDDGSQAAAQRLAAHAERAAALAEQLNQARQSASSEPERWDALLLSAEGQLRATTGAPEAALAPFLSAPLSQFKRPAFHLDLRAGLQAAIEAARSERHSGLAHWMPVQEQTGERCFAIVIQRAAFPRSLARAFGLSEMGPEPLYALAVLNTNSDVRDDALRESFGLTRAEWRIAQELKGGVSVVDAAARLSISVNTARTQVKAIFAKLGVERQSELVSRLNLTGRLGLATVPAGEGARAQSEAPPRRFITLDDGRKLAYREYGSVQGKPVLVFHQWFAASMLPAPAMEAAKSSLLRIVVFDRPGFGQSSPVTPYSFDGVARDAFTLADRLRMSRLRLIGMAPGAAFAMAAAAQQPTRIEKLALAAPRLRTVSGAQSNRKLQDQLTGLLRQPWIIRSFVAMMRSNMGERVATSMLRHASSTSPSDRREAAKPATAKAILAQGFDALETTAEGFIAELTLFAKSAFPAPGSLKCPIAVWQGAEDAVTPAKSVSDMFANISNAEVHIVPDEGVIFSANTYRAMFEWLRR